MRTGSLCAWASAFLLLPFRARLWTSPAPRHGPPHRRRLHDRHPGALDLASNLSALAFPDDRTFWDEFCARHGLSDNAARMLLLVGRDTLVEFAAWGADEREFFSRCTRPWLQGFSSPGGHRWVVCPIGPFGSTTVGRSSLCGVRLASTGWPRIRPGGLTPTTPFGGCRRCPPGGLPSGLCTRTRPATATMTRCLAASSTRTSRSSSRLIGFLSGRWSRRATMRPGPSTAGTTTWLAWGRGPGWCTPLAGKGMTTRSPYAGVASSGTWLSPWFGPRRPPSWAGYRGSGAANAGPAGASAGATTRTT